MSETHVSDDVQKCFEQAVSSLLSEGIGLLFPASAAALEVEQQQRCPNTLSQIDVPCTQGESGA